MYKYVQLSQESGNSGKGMTDIMIRLEKKKQEDERELIYGHGLELFKTCLEKVNALTVEGERRGERESTRRIREIVVREWNMGVYIHILEMARIWLWEWIAEWLGYQNEESQGTGLWEELPSQTLELSEAAGDGGEIKILSLVPQSSTKGWEKSRSNEPPREIQDESPGTFLN